MVLEDYNGEKESADESDCVYVRKPSNTSKSRRKSDERRRYNRDRRKTMAQLENRNENDSTERSVTATQCHCHTYRAGLRNCRCRKIRQSVSGKVSESELMNHETKLIVLEFLRALTPEKLTARSKSVDATSSSPSSRSASIDSDFMETTSVNSHHFQQEDDHHDIIRQIKQMNDFKEEYSSPRPVAVAEGPIIKSHSGEEEVTLIDKKPQTVRKNKKPPENDVVTIQSSYDRKRTKEEIEAKRASTIKYNTITIGEEEHKKFLEQLHKQLESQKVSLEGTGGVKLGRSKSDVTSEKYAAVRDKISAMKAPVEEWLEKYSNVTMNETKNVLHDIKCFDKTSLNKTKRSPSSAPINKKKWSNRKNQGLRYMIINPFVVTVCSCRVALSRNFHLFAIFFG